MTEAIGWASSLILLTTILTQVRKQWQSGTSKGVSKYLYIGQITASVGFTIYSWLLKNWVFTVTNGLLLLSAIAGLLIVFKHRRRKRGPQGSRQAAPAPA